MLDMPQCKINAEKQVASAHGPWALPIERASGGQICQAWGGGKHAGQESWQQHHFSANVYREVKLYNHMQKSRGKVLL